MSANTEIETTPRTEPDRRRTPTSPWAAFFFRGRRSIQRRTSEHLQPYFVDRFPAHTFILILLLLGLSIVDGVITLLLLQAGCEEINPVMNHLLHQGLLTFMIGKYILTAAGIPLLLVFQNHYLFRTRFRVGYLIPLFVVMYLCLVCYQLCLVQW